MTELKLNNPNAVRQARIFFGSDLLRVGDNDENITNGEYMDNDNDLINAVEEDDEQEQEQEHKPIEPSRRSPRIPKPNKRYEEDQEPEQEIIKPIPTKTKKSKPDEPIEPLRRSSRIPVPNKRYI